MTKVGNEILLLVPIVAFALYTFPVNYMTATSVLAVFMYVLTKSVNSVIGIFVGAILFSMFIKPSLPQGPPGSQVQPSIYTQQQREGFQAKDPITIHQRITANKVQTPAVPTITGVLESPNILDSLQISEVQPAEHGAALKTLPASIKAPEIIPTPPELTPPSTSMKSAPLSNPVLQNGPDNESVLTALISKGTALFKGQPSSEVDAAKTSGPSSNP